MTAPRVAAFLVASALMLSACRASAPRPIVPGPRVNGPCKHTDAMGPDAVTIRSENRVRLAKALAKHNVELITLPVLGTQPVEDSGGLAAGQVVTYQGVRAITGTHFNERDAIPRDTFVRFIDSPQRVASVVLFMGGRKNDLVEDLGLRACDCACLIIDVHPLSNEPPRACPTPQGIVHVYEPPGKRLQALYALTAPEVAPPLELDVPTIRAFAARPDTCRPEPYDVP